MDTASGRITIALIPRAAAHLRALQDATGLSKTDIVNRAISLYEFTETAAAAGAEILIRSPGGEMRQVKFL